MKPIEKKFVGKAEVKGIVFKQLARHNLIALYSRSDGYYEVITLKEQFAKTVVIAGVKVNYEEKEIYPSGESWTGKCVKALETAKKYFNSMVEAEKMENE